MVILPQLSTFAPGPAVSGSKPHGKCYKYCPYSTQITDYNQDSRIPEGDKVYHGETGGRMYSYSLGGPMGWVCPDNDCPAYTGIHAATVSGFEVIQHGRRFQHASGICPKTEEDYATISGSVAHLTQGRVLISGTRYFEI